jgi:hypothetical protein
MLELGLPYDEVSILNLFQLKGPINIGIHVKNQKLELLT